MKKVLVLTILLTLIAVPVFATQVYEGSDRVAVTYAGGATQYVSATARPVTEVTFCGLSTNTGTVVLGTTAVASATTRKGIPLDANDCWTYSNPQADLSTIQIDGTVTGDVVTYQWEYRS